MKRTIGYICVALLLLLSACQAERVAPQIEEGSLKVRISPTLNSFGLQALRSGTGADQEAIHTLRLLVFRGTSSDAHTFLYSTAATLNGDGTYTAELIPSSEPRIIHFVANYSFPTDTDQAFRDLDEGEVIPSLSGSDLYLWAREECSTGIPHTGILNLQPVMVRSQAKLTLKNETTHTISFKYIQGASKGTIAPFDTRNQAFTEGVLTLPNNVDFRATSAYVESSEALYTNERSNDSDTPLYILLKVQRAGREHYYKLDLLKNDYERYDLQRNHQYQLTIKAIEREGYATEKEAIDNMPANSIIDQSLEAFPAIFSSDGKAVLSVEQTTYSVGAAQPSFNSHFSYKVDGVQQNGEVKVECYPAAGTEGAIQRVDLYEQNGTMSVHLNKLQAGKPHRTARIILTAGTGEHQLKRVITVIQFAPFSFAPVTINGADPASIDNAHSDRNEAKIAFTIPEEYPKHLYPIPVQIITNTLNPAELILPVTVLKGGYIAYTYMAETTGEHTLLFKTNRKASREAVRIVAPNFQESVTGYNIGRFRGKLTYSYGTTIQQANLPEGRTSHLGGSYNITGNFESDGSFRYMLAMPLHALEGTNDEEVEVSVRVVMKGSVATTGTNLSYRRFTAKVPIQRFRDAYNRWKNDPETYQVPDIDLDLHHTSTYVFGAIEATDHPGKAKVIPEGAEMEVQINSGSIPAARGKVWRDNTFELEYPVDADVTLNSPVQVTFLTRQPTANAGVVIEHYTTPAGLTLGQIISTSLLAPTRSAIQVYGEVRGATGRLLGEALAKNRLFYTVNGARHPLTLLSTGRYVAEIVPTDLSEDTEITFERTRAGLRPLTSKKTVAELRESTLLIL